MKKIISFLMCLVLILGVSTTAFAKSSKVSTKSTKVTHSIVKTPSTVVSGYTKKSGTKVQPYHRTVSDSKVTNNYSHKGNINPYTGKVGTKKK